MNIRRTVVYTVAVIALVYVAYGIFYYFAQTGMIFQASKAPTHEGVREAYPAIREFWPEADGVRVEAWYLPPIFDDTPLDVYDPAIHNRDPAPMLIISHGNATLIDLWPSQVGPVREAGFGVLLVEYPGYGRSPGKPGQAIITKLFAAAFDTVVAWGVADTSRVVVMGRSLGGGVACQFVAGHETEALILISTFTSVRDFSTDYLLPGFVVRHPFDNEAVLREYDKPVMLVHATDDWKVPYDHAVRLSEASLTDTLITHNDGEHDMLQGQWPEFWRDTGLEFITTAIQ